jgi:hypothetical protein
VPAAGIAFRLNCQLWIRIGRFDRSSRAVMDTLLISWHQDSGWFRILVRELGQLGPLHRLFGSDAGGLVPVPGPSNLGVSGVGFSAIHRFRVLCSVSSCCRLAALVSIGARMIELFPGRMSRWRPGR